MRLTRRDEGRPLTRNRSNNSTSRDSSRACLWRRRRLGADIHGPVRPSCTSATGGGRHGGRAAAPDSRLRGQWVRVERVRPRRVFIARTNRCKQARVPRPLALGRLSLRCHRGRRRGSTSKLARARAPRAGAAPLGGAARLWRPRSATRGAGSAAGRVPCRRGARRRMRRASARSMSGARLRAARAGGSPATPRALAGPRPHEGSARPARARAWRATPKAARGRAAVEARLMRRVRAPPAAAFPAPPACRACVFRPPRAIHE